MLPKIERLYYITPVSNLSSIMSHGILSHNKAREIARYDISMTDVQKRRANKQVPNGLYLHDYANLYFDAHNPMLSKRRDQNYEICILVIDNKVLELPDVVLSDRNAASDYARFFPSPDGLENLNFDLIYDRYWTHPEDQIMEWKHKLVKCAEVLVPDVVPADYIIGAIVCDQSVKSQLQKGGFAKPINIEPSLFF